MLEFNAALCPLILKIASKGGQSIDTSNVISQNGHLRLQLVVYVVAYCFSFLDMQACLQFSRNTHTHILVSFGGVLIQNLVFFVTSGFEK